VTRRPGTPGVASRTRWFLLALLPVLGLRAMQSPAAFAALLGASLLLALALSALAVLLQRQPLRLAWLDEATWSSALLLPLWFGTGLSPAWLGMAQVVALLSRLAFAGMGQQPFHPAMAGIAWLLLLDQVGGVGRSPAPVDPLLAGTAMAFAAVLLAWRLRRDLRAPLALLLAFGAGHAIAHAACQAGPLDPGDWMPLWLAAAVVANDPVTTPSRPAARLAFGTGAGLAAALLPGGAGALPFALLALQAAAPWLDRNAGPILPVAASAPKPAPRAAGEST
jgi:Na+-translocating ferredoxin:NAD+ oxidoreductase RnfD subunit